MPSLNFLSESKRKEITNLLVEAGKSICSEYCYYKVEFSEDEGNVITKFIILSKDKEILHISNIMTFQGFKDLEERQGWRRWAEEQAEVLKKCVFEKAAKKKKNWFLRLFGKN